MKSDEKFDFGGYATKNNIRCSDGRIIRQDAFKHDNGRAVPLVWQHGVSDPSNILGHAILENRADGVYARGVFNDSANATNAKNLIKHGAINSLSIYANKLGQIGSDVMSGVIREVSLVLSGANPGAKIDTIAFSHGEFDSEEVDEAIIYSGEDISHAEEAATAEEPNEEVVHEGSDDETVGDILATLNDKQKAAVGFLLEELESDDEDAAHSEMETNHMKTNVFDTNAEADGGPSLTHDDFVAIMEAAKRGGSFRDAFLSHETVQTYGIENIGILFPDARSVSDTPDWIKRDTGWVAGVLSGTRHTPFSRVKSIHADITADEARAKGYVTGDEKVEEVFELLQRVTTPQTIYKKQKLDRDDMVDITDFNIVAWLRAEMRMMLDEEIARAVLVGDGRDVMDPYKIKSANVRPIVSDVDLYAHKVALQESAPEDIIDEIIRAFKHYKGTGRPVFYTTPDVVTDLLLVKDTLNRRLYNTISELAAALRVREIVEVEVMEDVIVDDFAVYGIIVNLNDYTIGADKGGEVNAFDDFDIDYNQYKYLIETRISGALTKPKSALVLGHDTSEPPVG